MDFCCCFSHKNRKMLWQNEDLRLMGTISFPGFDIASKIHSDTKVLENGSKIVLKVFLRYVAIV